MPEHRKFSRVPFDCQTFILAGERRYETQLVDISLKGLLVSTPPHWQPVDGPYHAEVRLLGKEVIIRMELALKHKGDGCLGFLCTQIDVESMTHLRRLLELNTGDPLLVERELAAMV